MTSLGISVCGENCVQSEDKKLIQPILYFEKQQKKTRQLLKLGLASMNYWMGLPPQKLQRLGCVIYTTQNFLFILDDICDGASLRQGAPTTHLIYGIPSTLSAANYTLSLVLQNLIEFDELEVLDIFLNHTINVFRGQGFEINFRNTGKCPTEEEYLTLVMSKSVDSCLMPYKMMQVFSTFKADLTKGVTAVGKAMQLMNDYVGLQSLEYSSSKGCQDDLTVGTFSFPIIHAIQSKPKYNKILLILKQKTRCPELKKYSISLMEKSGSFDYTKLKIQEFAEIASQEFEKFPGNPFVTECQQILSQSLDSDTALLKFFVV